MIRDADELADDAVLRADLCVVGAGPAGITLALQFLHAGRSVLLLESGGLADEPASQALYDGEVVDPALHAPPIHYRQRRFGGSTGIWGGRCVPLDPIDFERRDWIPDSGWPFGIETLLPYYPRANQLCEAGDFAYTAGTAFAQGMRPMLPDFRGHSFTDDTLERFSCPTDFGRRYRHRLAASRNVEVLLHANVTNLACNQEGTRITRLDVRSLAGRHLRVEARDVVLATGGLEVPRVLLASRDRHPAGIGNAHDLVGRYYMCHMAGTLGDIRFADRDKVWHGYELSDEGIYCRRRFALTEAAQRRLEVGNVVARLHHPRIPDPSHRTGILSLLYLAKPLIGYEYSKRLHSAAAPTLGLLAAHVRNILLDPLDTAAFLLDWARRRSLAERKLPSIIARSRAGRFSLDVHAEQVPNPSSRVTLGAQRDILGMPKITIDWRCSAADIVTVTRAMRALAADLAASGHDGLRYDEAEIARDILRDGAYGGHHIGTARMAAAPARGVVDADCRVHGMDNLFIAGSAVFPTSGQANPTLTIVALALRLADRLRARVAPACAMPLCAAAALGGQ